MASEGSRLTSLASSRDAQCSRGVRNKMKKSFSVGVLGVGAMGGAMVRGLVRSGFPPARILVFDLDKERLNQVVKTQGATAAAGAVGGDAAAPRGLGGKTPGRK
jgi:tRNA A37 threonylcarbamoyladenosine dehydratase